MFNKLKKNKKGYISIEVIVIAGLFVALGPFLIVNYVTKTDKLAQEPLAKTTQTAECLYTTGNPSCDFDVFKN